MADGDGPLGIKSTAGEFVAEFKDQGKRALFGVPQPVNSQNPSKLQAGKQAGVDKALAYQKSVLNRAIQDAANQRKQQEANWRQTQAASSQPSGTLQSTQVRENVGLETAMRNKLPETKGDKSNE